MLKIEDAMGVIKEMLSCVLFDGILVLETILIISYTYVFVCIVSSSLFYTVSYSTFLCLDVRYGVLYSSSTTKNKIKI